MRAVEGIDLDVNAGEIVCVVGESGCGKSVTVRSLFGLLPPPGRRAKAASSFDGVDLSDTRRAPRCAHFAGSPVGYVFQDPMTYLNPLLTAGAQVAEAACRIPDSRVHPPLAARVVDESLAAGSALAIQARVAAFVSAPVLRRHAPARNDRDGRGAPAATSSSSTSPPPRSTSRCRRKSSISSGQSSRRHRFSHDLRNARLRARRRACRPARVRDVRRARWSNMARVERIYARPAASLHARS